MTTKTDIESGDASSSSDGCRLEGPSPKKGLKQSLSRAFLSSGLQVTFKARRGGLETDRRGWPRLAASAAAAAAATHSAGAARRRTPGRFVLHPPSHFLLPAILHAQDITYTVVNSQNKKEKINLLQGVGGYLQAGEMAALMG